MAHLYDFDFCLNHTNFEFHINKTIKNNQILNDINLTFESGKIYGLQGKNGSGKTMIMKAICGFVRVDDGKVIVDDKIIGKDIDFAPDTGALIETPGFVGGYSAYQNLKDLACIRRIVDDKRIEDVINMVGLKMAQKKKYRQYSLGMKQKLGIAAAILEYPKLLILDEPTNALDEESIDNLRKILLDQKKQGTLIIISSHDKEELEFLADEIIVIENGKVKCK